MCPQCLGTLVKQMRLITLMDALTKDMRGVDFYQPIEAAETDPTPVSCPHCAKPMERFGYMETKLVYAWRCSSDWLVWADTEELGVMSVLYARTKTRRDAREAEAESEAESLNRRVHAMLRARFKSNGIGRGIPG